MELTCNKTQVEYPRNRYRVVWHSLLVDGQVTFSVTFKRKWTAQMFCWWMNRKVAKDDNGDRIRWFAVQLVENPLQ